MSETDSATPKCHGIIPTRYASTRFPGKPLVDILGKPMFWHVWNRSRLCPLLSSVTLATDDIRIFEAANMLNVPVVMTDSRHQSGTDRVYEAASKMNLAPDSIIVNIQGDEPAIHPDMLAELLTPFFRIEQEQSKVQVATLARNITREEAASPDRVKIVCKDNGEALYFSRSMIPFDREGTEVDALLHIGLYAFKMDALANFTRLAPSRLENIEKLEQLRLLENGIPVHVSLTLGACHGVDKEEDLEEAIRLLLLNPL